MLQFLKSPLGLAITATTVILAMSPEARKATRRLAVKGTSAMLDLVDQVRDQSATISQHVIPKAFVVSETQHEYKSDGTI